jgi:NAD(P)-dependent dehydrogenase (short-subunit alcohol dehydrogenase family)
MQSFLPLLRAAESAGIINASSGFGSVGLNNDLASPFYSAKPLGYNASKAALNMFTVNFAWFVKRGECALTIIALSLPEPFQLGKVKSLTSALTRSF